MSDRYVEEPLQFGDGGRLFGILTLPDMDSAVASDSPIFVLLNAGLVHRAGPHRLHARLARNLAMAGIRSLRVDLGGVGDSLAVPGTVYPESVYPDFESIMDLLTSEFDSSTVVLAGLCAGADNSVRLTPLDDRVVGMVLLDPVCDRDAGFDKRGIGFSSRALARKVTKPSKYLPWLKRQVASLIKNEADASVQDELDVRVAPTMDETRTAFASIGDRHGRVLSVFTQYALHYYNESGQLGRVLELPEYDAYCTELFWPQAAHTYQLDMHRAQLIGEVVAWATA